MDAKFVRQYLTQDFSFEEKQSYLEYIRGNESSIDWIEKANMRREPLLILELQCTEYTNDSICGAWVNVSEKGICTCSNGHQCYDVVLQALTNICNN